MSNSASKLVAPNTQALEDVIARTIRSDVRALQAYAVGDARGLVKLDAMENPYTFDAILKEQLARRLAEVAINRYPDPKAGALREMLARRSGLNADQDLLLGNGSDELISLVIAACARADACVLTVSPGFVMYRVSSDIAKVKFVDVPLRPDFQLDVPATLAAIREHQPNLVFIAYPNNPTGTLFHAADVKALFEASPGLFVVDEAYEAFSPDSFDAELAANPRLLVLRTLSKVGLAGIRLGYLMGHKDLMAQFDKVRPPYNINVMTQCAALFALEHDDVLLAQAKAITAQRSVLSEALARRAGIEVFSSAANFLLFRVQGADPALAARVFAGLRDHGVLIKNVSSSHALLNNCLRVTVSTPQENQLFLKALDAVLPSLTQSRAPDCPAP